MPQSDKFYYANFQPSRNSSETSCRNFPVGAGARSWRGGRLRGAGRARVLRDRRAVSRRGGAARVRAVSAARAAVRGGPSTVDRAVPPDEGGDGRPLPY